MVHATCAVRDCLSSSYIHKDLRFHRMPCGEDRCRLWVEACRRPDLVGQSLQSLKYKHICSLHFEIGMYRKKSLKRTAIPTLRIPNNESVQTQTDISILDDITFDIPNKEYHELSGSFSQTAEYTGAKQYRTDHSIQTPTQLTDKTLQKRKLSNKSLKTNKNLKLCVGTYEDITENQFLNGCDKFLSPKLSAIVKSQIYLKPHCKNNRFSRDFKLLCLNMYYTSPLAYRFLSKTICLPSKSTLANMYLPVKTKVTQQMWDVLAAVVKNMSLVEKECVLCMDKMSLKLNLSYYTKTDKILGLHEIDGQQQPVAARYAFTLMLRGITSKWELPIGFSFICSSKINNQLKTWIIATVQHILQLGFNIRAFVSGIGSDFLAFSKILGISKEISFFEIDGHKIYYIFDVPHLMKCVRNNLINYNFEFDDKTARWEDITNLYKQDKMKDIPSAPRLTDAHIQPNSFQKQKVRLAVEVFSNSVVAALKSYQSAGILQIANGTIDFIETMNNLFELLNSSDINSPKPCNEPYSGITVQEKILQKSTDLFNCVRVKNKSNGRDVTNIVKFINGFIITINSLRELYNDMKLEGYDNIFTRRINNDCLEKMFGLVRQAGRNCWKPTCIQYVKAFRKIFFCQILNLSDATNCTEDFDSILAQFVEFSKKSLYPVSTQNSRQKKQLQENIRKEYDIPERNAFHYLCCYLLRRCVESHKRNCSSIVSYASSYSTDDRNDKYLYMHLSACDTGRDLAGEGQIPPDDFVDYIYRLETELMSLFSFPGNNIGFKLFDHLSLIKFKTKPCACFPKKFLIKLFIRIRIFYMMKFYNRKFKSGKSISRKCLSVAHL